MTLSIQSAKLKINPVPSSSEINLDDARLSFVDNLPSVFFFKYKIFIQITLLLSYAYLDKISFHCKSSQKKEIRPKTRQDTSRRDIKLNLKLKDLNNKSYLFNIFPILYPSFYLFVHSKLFRIL